MYTRGHALGSPIHQEESMARPCTATLCKQCECDVSCTATLCKQCDKVSHSLEPHAAQPLSWTTCHRAWHSCSTAHVIMWGHVIQSPWATLVKDRAWMDTNTAHVIGPNLLSAMRCGSAFKHNQTGPSMLNVKTRFWINTNPIVVLTYRLQISTALQKAKSVNEKKNGLVREKRFSLSPDPVRPHLLAHGCTQEHRLSQPNLP